ncbi:dienelactone hydrolase family protein [Lysinibacillus sp. NPDC047702]|uniref:dienelactone hydrolase family protein n=1 Tax=unclassified Lysinibacillus TaxID=2636778 RepID=UPI003D07F121
MKRKVFILHEIYGINDFIKMQATAYENTNTKVECISLYPENKTFTYKQEQEAYLYFNNNVGFDAPLKLLTHRLLEAKKKYDEVVLIGYSVGATLAWRLSSLPLHRVICVYGSRIRQYLDVIPACPTFVIFPSTESSFNVHEIKETLNQLPTVETKQFIGLHGFMDCYNPNYCYESYLQAHFDIIKFIENQQDQGGQQNEAK